MDFEFSADQEALRDTVRRFLADKAPLPWVRERLDDQRATTDDVWKGLAALGATGLLVREEHGGAGTGMVDMGVVLEEMGRLVHPGPFLSSAVAAVSAVALAGSPTDHAAYLPSLADGSLVGTVALLEAGAGNDWRDVATLAEPASAPDGWTLTGAKSFVPDAGAGDVLFVTAREAGGRLGLFAVERHAPGLGVTPLPTVDATRRFADLTLAATPARRLGDPRADATEAVAEVVDRILTALVVDGVGAASAALELAVAYANERVQFDRPIGSFQAVQHLCADMLQAVESGRAGAYYALWASDAAEPAERHRAATMAKAFASDAFFRVGAGAIQVFGGIGFTWEHDAHLFYKRLLTLQQAHGSGADHLEELASIIL